MTQITSEVLLVVDLLTKGRFAVPWHQRYYDWTTEQVGELLADLKEALDENRSSYFLGACAVGNSRGSSDRKIHKIEAHMGSHPMKWG